MPNPSLLILVLLVGCSDSNDTAKVDAAAMPDDSGTIDSVPADANPDAPTCVIDMPSTGASTAFDVPVTLKATATDPQDGVLSGSAVEWRTSLQVAPLVYGNMSTITLPPGDNLITCTATDSTSLTGTSAITMVRSRSPFAQINHPGNNEPPRMVSNGPFPFTGVARDLEDGNLTGASLVWTSSLDGALGTGLTFNRNLSVGTHVITLVATDAAAKTDSTTVTVIMVP